MDMNDITIGELRQLQSLFNNPQTTTKQFPIQIGKTYLFRGVTYFWTGRVTGIVGAFAVLECATWIASTGRFADFMKEGGQPQEAEPVADDQAVFVNMDACNDIVEWRGDLPRKQT